MDSSRLNQISQAIGALQQGQLSAETARKEHAARSEKQFETVAADIADLKETVSRLAQSIDEKIDSSTESAIRKYMHGSIGGIVGGVVTIMSQWAAIHMGIKIP